MIKIEITGDNAAEVINEMRTLLARPMGGESEHTRRKPEHVKSLATSEFHPVDAPGVPVHAVSTGPAGTPQFVEAATKIASAFTPEELADSAGPLTSTPEFNPFSQNAVAPTPPTPAVRVAPPIPAWPLPATEAGALDVQGLPWDARIHASTKTKNADGKWKLKRGVDAAVVQSVEAELRRVVAIPASATPAVVPPPPIQSAVAVPPPPVDANVHAPTFQDMTIWLAAEVAAQRVTFEQVEAVTRNHGFESFASLEHRPDLVSSVWDELKALNKS